MLMPADRVHEVLGSQFATLQEQLNDRNDASPVQAITVALQLLATRERQTPASLRARLEKLRQLADQLAAMARDAGQPASPPLAALQRLLQPNGETLTVAALEALWREALGHAEDLVDALRDATLDEAQRRQLLTLLTDFEVQDLQEQLGSAARPQADSSDRSITREKLTAYLQQRCDDPSLQLTALQPLSGGFGKETILFGVEGKSLSGEFVMRRDLGDGAVLDNDCHHVHQEYRLIRAVHAAGFPAPDAVWLDTEHELLPGGDFIVMRRSPGTIGGNVFGAQTTISPELTEMLARELAALHQLPPLTELGDLTESINSECWGLSRGEANRRYLLNWYRFWRSETHAASPALASLYGWLLKHLPERDGRASLLHGDIGFHNFLVHEGRLSALLDWEFAHVGDPAEDLGYVKVTTQGTLDWDHFMACYLAAGGEPVDEQTLHFFQVWTYVRNASAGNIFASRLATGQSDDLKLCILPYYHFPQFIRGAQQLIAGL